MSTDHIDEYTDAAERYRNIFNTVSQDLNQYENEIGDYTEAEARKIDAYAESLFEKVLGKVHQYNKSSYTMYKNCEDVDSWFQRVKTLQDTIFKVDTKDTAEWGNFLFKQAQNSRQLQEMETEVLAKLRQLVNEEESPEYIRLKLMRDDMASRLEIRKSVANQLENEINIAITQLNNTIQSRDTFVREMEKAEQTLKIFTAKNSFQIVQDARKKEIIEHNWIRRNIELVDSIETLKKEIEQFHNPEKFESEMKKISLQQDAEYKKLNSQYEDELFIVNHELSQISSTHQSMMETLKKELNEIRSEQLKQERKLTNTSVKQEKMSSDRFINNYKKIRFASIKSIEKEFKRTTIKLNDLINIITEDHKKDVDDLKANISKMYQELQEILKRRQGHIGNMTNFQLTQLQSSNQISLAALQAKKEQIIEKSLHKDIEIDALNRQIVPVEGVYNDLYQIYSTMLDQQNNFELMYKTECDKISGIQQLSESRNKARSRFISNAKKIILILKEILRNKMKRNDPLKEIIKNHRKITAKDDFEIKIIPEFKIKQREISETQESQLKEEEEYDSEPLQFESPYKPENSEIILPEKSNSEQLISDQPSTYHSYDISNQEITENSTSHISEFPEHSFDIKTRSLNNNETIETSQKSNFENSQVISENQKISSQINESAKSLQQISEIALNKENEALKTEEFSEISAISAKSATTSEKSFTSLASAGVHSLNDDSAEFLPIQIITPPSSSFSSQKDFKPREPTQRRSSECRKPRKESLSAPETTTRKRSLSGVVKTKKDPIRTRTNRSEKSSELSRPSLLLPKTDIILGVRPVSGRSSHSESFDFNASEREPRVRRRTQTEEDRSFRFVMRGSVFGEKPKKRRNTTASRVKVEKILKK